MNRKLEGKVALVTGGSSGIGLATAERFVAEGAFVYITGRRQAQLDAAVKKIGSNVKGVQADVSKPADLDRLYAQIKKEKGRLDTVFANAGGGTFLPLGSITEQQYHETFDNNVKGVILTVQKALALLPNIMLYWLSNTEASSARLYFESFATEFSTQKLDLPVAVSVFPGELYRPLKVWGERAFSKPYYWNEVARGGHFAAFEQPEIFVAELRKSFAQFR